MLTTCGFGTGVHVGVLLMDWSGAVAIMFPFVAV